MPADPEQTAALRELHEEFAWKVNAAVAEGREDLIRRYSGEYVEKAADLLIETAHAAGGACDREACEACRRPRLAPPLRQGRWRRLTRAYRRRPHL
jgi:hypothetical protein